MSRLRLIRHGFLTCPPFRFGPEYYYSSDRDNRAYTGYVGFQHNFLPNLNVSAKAGATYTEDYNDPLSSASVTPYAVLSVIYTYLPGSYVQIGLNQIAKRDGCGRA